MKELRQYIRQVLLTETVNPKIMSMIDTLESNGGYVEILPDRVMIWEPSNSGGTRWVAMVAYETPAGARAGGKCGRAGGVVQSSTAKTGLGPLAYDVAIEAQEGMGLISDRGSVSDDAQAVWYYYLNNRPDVEAVQLDDLDNTLTPEDEDNCDQHIARSTITGMYNTWQDSALSKLYKKSGTPVMDELQKRGMLK